MIEARDVSSIYAVPLAYHEAGLDAEVLAAFGIEPARQAGPDALAGRSPSASPTPRARSPSPSSASTRGMKDAYKSLIEALIHGGIANRVQGQARLDRIRGVRERGPAPFLEHVHGILVPGGFGQRGAEGKIRAAGFARERKVPYFGICFGMQMAVIEAARNRWPASTSANSTEFGPCDRAGRRPDDRVDARQRAGDARGRRRPRRHHAARRLHGAACRKAAASPTSTATTEISERHRHRYEVNMGYRDQLEAQGHALRRRFAGRHCCRRRSSSRTIPGSSACSITPS